VIAIIATVAKQERVRISQRVKAGLETARAKGKRLGRPQVVVDVRRIAALRQQGRSWPQIAKQLGVGVGTVYRDHQELSKNLGVNNLSTIPDMPCVAAD
jgi:DNA invertase Pin-like site-specific DNA recombinase